MDISSLGRIERMNYILGVVLFGAAALLMSWPHALGVMVGVLLSCLNFTIMRGMVHRWIRTAPERRGPQALVLVPKMAGLMGALFLSLHLLPVTGLGVLIGFSVFLGSIAIETVRFAVSPPGAGAQGGPEGGAGAGAARDSGPRG